MLDGMVPYRDFDLEYPPLAAGLFALAGLVGGDYADVFAIMMAACLCATVLGVMATARQLGFDRRREVVAGGLVALSPLLLGNLVETRFDLALAALLTWTVWAAVAGRWRLAWGLLAAAVLLKLVPLALVPAMILLHRHRAGTRAALRGLAGSLAVVAAVAAPFIAMSPEGSWRLVSYHLERPLQIESTGSAYLLGLHALADIPIRVVASFGSQGLSGDGPRVISIVITSVLAATVAAIAVTLGVLLRRARAGADARLFVAAVTATTAALLAGGKVLSPQFLVWLLPTAFLVAGPRGRWALGAAVASMLLTLAYFPHDYWDLVALETWPIALVVVRDMALIALVVLAWPRPAVGATPKVKLPPRATPAAESAAERAVAARYLVD
jgi:hypothetical protein